MNKTLLHTALLFLGIVIITGVTSCRNDDEVITGDPTPPTQSISFLVKIDTLFAYDALCGLAANASDRDNGIFLRTGTTNYSGRVKFDNLSPFTYYYNVSYLDQGTTRTKKGTIQLDSLDKLTENVQF